MVRTYSRAGRLSPAAGAGGQGGHSDGASDLGPARAGDDGSGPVGAVLNIGVVGLDVVQLHDGAGGPGATSTLGNLAGLTALTTLLRELGAHDGFSAEERGDDGGVLHLE